MGLFNGIRGFSRQLPGQVLLHGSHGGEVIVGDGLVVHAGVHLRGDQNAVPQQALDGRHLRIRVCHAALLLLPTFFAAMILCPFPPCFEN